MGSEWVFPFFTRLAPPHRKTHSDPIFTAMGVTLAPSFAPGPEGTAAAPSPGSRRHPWGPRGGESGHGRREGDWPTGQARRNACGSEVVAPGGDPRPRAGRGGRRRRLPVAARIAPRDRRRAERIRARGSGGGGARPERRPAHPRPERGGRPLRPRLRPRAGPPVADGDEPPDRGRAARRGAGAGRARHGPAAADARAPPPGRGHPAEPRSGREAPHRRLRQRGQRVARDAGGSSAARVPDRRVRARALDGGRHRGVAQGDGPRPWARMDARPHAAPDVGLPRAGPGPRFLYALPRGHAARGPASRVVVPFLSLSRRSAGTPHPGRGRRAIAEPGCRLVTGGGVTATGRPTKRRAVGVRPRHRDTARSNGACLAPRPRCRARLRRPRTAPRRPAPPAGVPGPGRDHRGPRDAPAPRFPRARRGGIPPPLPKRPSRLQ